MRRLFNPQGSLEHNNRTMENRQREALRILEEFRKKIVEASDAKLERGKGGDPEQYKALYEANVLINSVYALSMDLMLQRASIEESSRLLVSMSEEGRLSIRDIEDLEAVYGSIEVLKAAIV
jgi:hypothetical protein